MSTSKWIELGFLVLFFVLLVIDTYFRFSLWRQSKRRALVGTDFAKR